MGAETWEQDGEDEAGECTPLVLPNSRPNVASALAKVPFTSGVGRRALGVRINERAAKHSVSFSELATEELRDGEGAGRHLFRRSSGNFGPEIAEDVAQVSPGTYLAPSSRSSRLARSVRSTITQVRLKEIRTAELVEQEGEDSSLQGLPIQAPTFRSNAHLRSEAYWEELMGHNQPRYPCEFVESTYFQTLACVSIIMAAVLLNMDGVEPPWSGPVETAILVFSIFETAVVLHRHRAGVTFASTEAIVFFCLESTAIVGCAIDMWVLPLIGLGKSNETGEMTRGGSQSPWANLSPILRMLWLLRLVRLIQLVPQLHELFHGVLDALQGLFWVLLFMVLLLYAVSILCTRLIGHAELRPDLTGEKLEQVQAVQAMFSNIGESMFTLFMLMSSWSLEPLVPLIRASQWARSCFIAFYIFAGWTLLAVMTGTVSFHMLMSKAKILKDEFEIERRKIERTTEMLDAIFSELDEDGSGSICHEDFKLMLHSKDLRRTLTANRDISLEDLEDVWRWLDPDGSDCVQVEDLMKALLLLNEPFTPKSVFKMQEKVSHLFKHTCERLHKCIEKSFDDIANIVTAPLRKLHATTEQAQILSASMGDTCSRLGVAPAGYTDAPSMLGLQKSVSNRIAQIEWRLLKFRPCY